MRTGISSACISRNEPDLDRTLRRDGSHVVELPVDGPDVEHGVEQVNRGLSQCPGVVVQSAIQHVTTGADGRAEPVRDPSNLDAPCYRSAVEQSPGHAMDSGGSGMMCRPTTAALSPATRTSTIDDPLPETESRRGGVGLPDVGSSELNRVPLSMTYGRSTRSPVVWTALPGSVPAENCQVHPSSTDEPLWSSMVTVIDVLFGESGSGSESTMRTTCSSSTPGGTQYGHTQSTTFGGSDSR